MRQYCLCSRDACAPWSAFTTATTTTAHQPTSSPPIATPGSLARWPRSPHSPPSHPLLTCCRNTASTARARSQAPPPETSLTSFLPLARHSRASRWTQTTLCRHPGMLHRTSASTLATRICSISRTTHKHGSSPHGKLRRARSPPRMALHPLVCTLRTHKACKNPQNTSQQNISCHPREHAPDDSEMTTAFARSPRVASTRDEPRGRQKALAAETAEYTTALLCPPLTTREHPQERAVTMM